MAKEEWLTVPCHKSTTGEVIQGKSSLSSCSLDGCLFRWPEHLCQDLMGYSMITRDLKTVSLFNATLGC